MSWFRPEHRILKEKSITLHLSRNARLNENPCNRNISLLINKTYIEGQNANLILWNQESNENEKY